MPISSSINVLKSHYNIHWLEWFDAQNCFVVHKSIFLVRFVLDHLEAVSHANIYTVCIIMICNGLLGFTSAVWILHVQELQKNDKKIFSSLMHLSMECA